MNDRIGVFIGRVNEIFRPPIKKLSADIGYIFS